MESDGQQRTFVEAVHVELAYEGGDIGMFEILTTRSIVRLDFRVHYPEVIFFVFLYFFLSFFVSSDFTSRPWRTPRWEKRQNSHCWETTI